MLDAVVQVVRATGTIGVYELSDEGAATEDAQDGRYDFDYGAAFTKGITIGSGQCPLMRYNRWLRDLIIRGQASPGQIISHQLSLDDAVHGYDQFDRRVDGWTKVVPRPAPPRDQYPHRPSPEGSLP